MGAPSRERDRLELLALAIIALVGRAAFVYRGGMPDPDCVAMAAGMAIGMSGDVPVGDAILYGRHVSPGLHVLVSCVFPHLFGDPHHLIGFLNWMTVLSASVIVFPVYSLLRRHLPHRTVLAAVAVWVFTPVAWEAGTYYHPLVPATLLLALALVCAHGINRSPRGVAALVATVLLAAAAVIVRVEVVVVWPALVVWALLSKERRGQMLLLVVVTLFSVGVYLAASRLLSSGATMDSPGVGDYVATLVGMYSRSFNLRGLPRSLTWMVLAVGVATIGACVLGLARFLRGQTQERGDARLLAFGLACALPSILFWLPQPTPIVRHYLLASMGLVIVLATTVLGRLTPRRLVAVATAVIVLNLAVPDLLYRAYNATRAPAKTPNGSFFYFHEQAAERIARNRAVADRIASCSTRDDASPPLRSCAVVRWEEFAYVVHAAATCGRRVEPHPNEMIFRGVRYSRFGVGDGELRLVTYVYFEDATLREAVARILEDSRANGFRLFAPHELRDRVPELRVFGNTLEGY